jgi:hypothetical protein
MKDLMKKALVSKKNRKVSKMTKSAIKNAEDLYSYWMN